MDVAAVSPELAATLGPEATGGLVEVVARAEKHCEERVIARAVDRFERRLVEEVSKVRVEITQLDAGMRREIADVRHDLRQDLANQKFDLLKWSFLFWVGQVAAVGLLLKISGH
jgi:hypothetical protein